MSTRRAPGAVWAVAVMALCAGGCRAHLGANMQQTRASTPAGEFVFSFEPPDRQARDKVEQAIRNAAPALAAWGGVREPVAVYILPSHRALEDAVHRNGYAWLKAWARYEEIFLQSPRTWSVFGARQADVDELVLHELTHTVMYQQAADSTHWARKGIPLWFREGMASYTANQGYRWPTLEDLARFYDDFPGRDPLLDPDPLYQNDSDIVYGAAHHAFTFLVNRYGRDGVKRLLAQMRAGDDFGTAFAGALAISQERFTKDFQNYVRWRGFRGGRIRRPEPATGTPAGSPESDIRTTSMEPFPPPARRSDPEEETCTR
ncbi:MAG: hypothetical protein IRZ16_04965 [Myxococcaceae bacterium]|nr:hypothetical protein [Myxococcaceae bacterium]